MPVEITWQTPDHIVLFRLSGALNLDDMDEMAAFSRHLIQSQPRAVIHALVDLRQVEKLTLALTLRELKDIFGMFDSKNRLPGWIIMVGTLNPMLKFVISVMGQLFKFRFRREETIEAALAFLQEADPALVAVPPIP